MSTTPRYSRGYHGFRGVVGRTGAESVPWWPSEPTAPRRAPNVVIVLVDDLGYSDIGPFGSEIPTPNLDRLAATGLRLTNYHTAPLCSPARAALLTGLNPHRAGYGYVANADPGFPGVRLELADDVATLAESLRAGGYATYAVGKWHLVRDANMAPGRPRDSWPTQRGFDRYYGSLEGLNSFFHPNQLVADNSVLDIEEYPPGYYVTDDLTDRAIGMITDLRAHDADRPFLLYFAHVAMHGPLQAKADDLAAQRGRYAEGWDVARERRFARQLADGLFPPGTRAAQRNPEPGYDVPPWAELTADQRARYARYMEVYAAMVTTVDGSLGRITDTLAALGELDNTIIVFTSDNGGTAEGGPTGTRSYFSQFVHAPVPPDWERDVPHDSDLTGTEHLGVHYPRGWGQVSNTPFRFYKGQTYAGGVRVPFLLAWPAGLPRAAGDPGLRHQYAYVTDLAPTILRLTGAPALQTRAGGPTRPMDGVDLRPVLDSPDVAGPHREQYAEMGGHLGFYRAGWKLLALRDAEADIGRPTWRLYDTRTDPTELDDVADRYPDRVRELAAAWEAAAWRNTVFPLLADAQRSVRRPAEKALTRPVRLLVDTPVLERYRSARLVQYRSFTDEAELAGHVAGDEGVLVAHGDLMGGYLLYVEEGRVRVLVNAYGRHAEASGPLPVGTRLVTLDVAATPDLRWNLTLHTDEVPVARLRDQVALVGMAPWTGISVGRDARGPVSAELRRRRGTFRYTGALVAVTYTPGAPALPASVVERIKTETVSRAD